MLYGERWLIEYISILLKDNVLASTLEKMNGLVTLSVSIKPIYFSEGINQP